MRLKRTAAGVSALCALIVASACTSVVAGDPVSDGAPRPPKGDPAALLVPREDFPDSDGTFKVGEQPDDDGPRVTPAKCNMFVNHDTVPFEQASAQYEYETIRVDVVVGFGITHSLESIAKTAEQCGSVTLDLDDIGGTGHVSMEKIAGAAVETSAAVFRGSLNADGAQSVDFTIKTLTAHPRGSTVTVKVLHGMEPWAPDNDEMALTLLNKQIAKVLQAP